ncbi:MAG: hypothetical protein AAF721_13010 [Myxococcota bacterium]
MLRTLALASLAALSACSKSHTINFTVTLAGDVAYAEGAKIAYSILEWDRETFDSEPADESEPLVEGQREYSRTIGLCCVPNPNVRLYAFVDYDADRKHDVMEAWGKDPTTPIKLGNDPHEARITILPIDAQ